MGKKDYHKKSKNSLDLDNNSENIKNSFSNNQPNCPTCDDMFSYSMIQNIPCVHHAHSIFICRVSGEEMNENNPPMVLPNGEVYSKNTIDNLTTTSTLLMNNGNTNRNSINTDSDSLSITCPMTGDIFPISKIRRAYLV